MKEEEEKLNFEIKKNERMISQLLTLSSSIALAILIGAHLTESFLLVPYWKKLSPNDFFTLHFEYSKVIHNFYTPITILAVILPIISTTYHLVTQFQNQSIHISLAFTTLLFLSTYYLYFKKANISFAQRSIEDRKLSTELIRWSKWHWTRIFIESLALLISIQLNLSVTIWT